MNKAQYRVAAKSLRIVSSQYLLKASDDDLAKDFQDEDSLTVALSWSKYLKIAASNDSNMNCPVIIQNSKCRAFKACTAPKPKVLVNACTRCEGTGEMPYKHVKGGVCFKCNGTGK